MDTRTDQTENNTLLCWHAGMQGTN